MNMISMYLVTRYTLNIISPDTIIGLGLDAFFHIDYKKSIITQSFSKSKAMTGYRIGYAIAEPSIIDKMSKLQALSLTNVSEPIQYVALQALDKHENGFIICC